MQIQIGLMTYDGCNHKVRGATVMVAVERNAIAAEILECAVDKHCACDCSLPRTTYRLLYKDGQLVENLPGSSDAFILD